MAERNYEFQRHNILVFHLITLPINKKYALKSLSDLQVKMNRRYQMLLLKGSLLCMLTIVLNFQILKH